MSDKVFRPFGFSDEEYDELLVLRDGVPPDLREPLKQWLLDQLTYIDYSFAFLDRDLANRLRSMTRVDLGQRANQSVDIDRLSQNLSGLRDIELLRLVDALASMHDGMPDISEAFDLSSSRWRIANVDGEWRLAERLPEGVVDATMDTIARGGKAGELLHRAFTAAYGITPNEGEAYKMAVKAVETAAHPLIEPKNTGATLGTMLAVMRNAKQPWTILLDERADHVGNNASFLLNLMQALWDGQEDRHRDGEVTLAEARTAFHAATTLVAWFTGRLVTQDQIAESR